MTAVDISISLGLLWLAVVLFVRLVEIVRAKDSKRHVWGEFDSAQIARMRRRPDRR